MAIASMIRIMQTIAAENDLMYGLHISEATHIVLESTAYKENNKVAISRASTKQQPAGDKELKVGGHTLK